MTPEQLQQLIDALAAQGGAVDELNQKLQDLTNSQLDLVAAQNQSATVAEQRVVAAAQKEIEARQRTIAALVSQEAAMKQSIATMAEGSKKIEAENELIEIQIEKLKLLAKAEDASTDAGNRAIAESKKKQKELAKEKKVLDKHKTSVDGLTDSFSTLFSGTAPEIGSLLNAKNLKGIADKFKGVNGGVKGFIKAGAPQFAMQFATAIAKLAVELGDVENAFMKATGASEDFARSISNTYEEGRKFTASAADMGASATSLFNNFTDFSYQDQTTREGLIKTAAVLDKLGISNEAFSKSVQISTKGLGMGTKEAGQAMLDLSGFAEELGVSPERLSAQFLEAGEAMAKLGENGDEAFRDLAAAAKVTGLEVNKLLNIVNQFDTFEGAARQAGKLNAALGGNFVNAMDLMMETDPTARFEMIRDSILDTGLSFEEMSYYQKNFYKDAMGLESVGDLAMALSGSLDSVSEETKMTTRDFEEQAKRAKTLASFQEQLNAVFRQMIPILTPLIDAFRGLMTFISENITMFKILGGALLVAFGGIPGIVIAVVSLFDAIKMGSGKVSVLSALMKGMMVPFKFLGDGFKELKKTIVEAFGGTDEFSEKMEAMIPIVEGLGTVLGVVLLWPLMKAFLIFGKVTAAVIWLTTAISGLMGAFAEKHSLSFNQLFTDGALSKSLELVQNVFSMLSSKAEGFGDVIGGVIAKINEMIASMVEMGQAVADSFLGKALTGVMSFISDEPAGLDEERLKQSSRPQPPANTAKMQETMASANASAVGRTAAPTAASTNIASNSSSNTYINSGPKEIVTEVKIGNESIKRIVTKAQDNRASRAATSRT